MSRDPYEPAFRKIHDHLRRHEAAIGQLQDYAKKIAAQPRYAPVQQDTSDVDELRNHEVHYANVILLIGYGGFFALWSSCADRMHPWTFGLLGLAMGLSLLMFVAFEIVKTLANTLVHNRAAKRDAHGRRLLNNADYLRELRASGERVNEWWAWFFVPALVLGLGAGIGLLVFFVRVTLQG